MLDGVKFEALYREHYACVWRTLRRLGVSEKDASDLTQEVFLTAHRRFGEFEARSTERTWLIGIAYRLAANYRRRAAGRHELFAESALEEAVDAVDMERQIEHREDVARLELVLQKLPLEQRAVFTMFEMEGLTGEEIADALEVPLGTVRSRIRLARDAFSAALTSFERPAGLRLVGGRP